MSTKENPSAGEAAAADTPVLVAVLDMGASAIRLAIAEIVVGQPPRIVEELSRRVSLGRDSFSSGGAIRSRTGDAVIAAVDGFRTSMELYGVSRIRAAATSAVREARNGDVFLDRIRRRTGIDFDIINEAEEGRLLYLAVRDRLKRHAAFSGARTLLIEVGGGSTSLSLLRRGQPTHSGVYALGSIRVRQQLDLQRHSHDVQLTLLRRYIANIIEEIRVEVPLNRITHIIAVGGDVRFAAAQILDSDSESGTREVARDRFLAFCDEIARVEEDELVERFRMPPSEAETLAPALLVYRALVAETAARGLAICDASLRAGMLLDIAARGDGVSTEEFGRQVLTSAESLGQRYRLDLAHGRHVADLAVRLFDELADEHGLQARQRLLLQVAALLHDVGIYVSLRSHHKHTQYILAASQIFGLSDEETGMVANIARYHRGALPQKTHLPYVALDREDRITVDKLAAILRIANALDAEHVQKVRGLRLVRRDTTWMMELDSSGDLTMERLAATARSDLFVATFGRQLVIAPSIV
jgi:exopolyphosphatase / guanosine-5'-triphosphate,3'-diphosphate pyrophosphatase